jgi:glycosyltransferase involved in cell wall biosynthesis
MQKITFCIPSKSNLQYLKTCIPSIRNNAFRGDHNIIIFVDSDEDGTVAWLVANKDKYNFNFIVNPDLGKKLYGIGKAYDKCIELSETEVFMIFHADMILGKHADIKAWEQLKDRKDVVCATRIEPPLHPNAGEKILKDFGMYPENFKEEDFHEFIETNLNEEKLTEGIFAPWMMYKDEFLSMGGHDIRMHSCREDSDVFNRLYLAGFNFKQPWNSLVYHFTGRGAGSFDGDKERHEQWKRDMNNSTREFIRKWKSNVKHTPLMKPIVPPVYDIGIKIINSNLQLVGLLEPWCNNLYVDCDYRLYIDSEQPNTYDILATKILPIDEKPENDIIISLDGKTFNQQDFAYLQEISQIIEQSGQVGESKLGQTNIYVTINNLNEYQNDLIKI